MAEFSPMMQRYLETKKEYEDCKDKMAEFLKGLKEHK